MKIKYTIATRFVLIISLVAALYSCSDFLDVPAEEVVTAKNMYRDKNDADAAVKGIYGKFMTLAEQYVVLNELRADLMDVTPNADYYLQQINSHNVSADNPYADPTPFYELINECNDALVNFTKMHNELKLLTEPYNQRYSDIGTLRSFLYLELVTQYGKVPYITKPMESVESMKTLEASAPMLDIPTMVDTLVSFMESLPTLDRYTDPDMRTSIDGYPMNVMFIDKKFFMGDLYLWQNNYLAAASMYKSLMDMDISGASSYDSYKIPRTFDPYNVDKYNSNYYRYYYWDVNSKLNHWPYMFSTKNQDADFYTEWIWVMEFDKVYKPTNPFFKLFSKSQGEYMLKPSESIIDLWNSQVQQNGFMGDFRGNTGSYKAGQDGSQPEITKYTSEFDPLDPFNKEGKFMLQRAALLHLRYSEAANRDGEHKIAYYLINQGMSSYNPIPNGVTDVSMYQRTLKPFPYDFDALSSAVYHQPSMYRGPWYRNTGIRGRVYLESLPIPEGADSLQAIEHMLINEDAREMAFEGNRWGDLVRIALRENDPSILADRVYEKLKKDNHPEAEAVKQKLMNPENWFLPLPTK